MSRTKYKSAIETLEVSRIRLENVKKQALIYRIMSMHGYDDKKIEEGWQLLTNATNAYNQKKLEDFETSEVKDKLDKLSEKIYENLVLDRKKSRIAFEKTPDKLRRLGVDVALSEKFIEWVESANMFYTTSLADEEIQAGLAKLQSDHKYLKRQKADLETLLILNADYTREKGESKEATADKNKEFTELNKWMSDFKAVAKIAFVEHPQLLEALRIKA